MASTRSRRPYLSPLGRKLLESYALLPPRLPTCGSMMPLELSSLGQQALARSRFCFTNVSVSNYPKTLPKKILLTS